MKLKKIMLAQALCLRQSFFVILSWCVICCLVYADDTKKSNNDIMEEVEVTSSVPEKYQQYNDSAARVIVESNEIQQYGDTELQSVLKRQPGVTVVDGEVRLRGLGNRYTQILLNGVPAPPGFSIDSVSPEIVERIEILRSGAAEYSSQGIAGTINIVLRETIEQKRKSFKLGILHENGPLTPSASLQISDKIGEFSYSVSGDATNSKYDYLEKTEEFIDTSQRERIAQRILDDQGSVDSERINLVPNLNWSFNNGDKLKWQNVLKRSKFALRFNQQETTIFGSPTEYPSNNFIYESETDFVRSDIVWNHLISGDTDITIKLGFNRSQRDADFIYTGFDLNDNKMLVRPIKSDFSDDNLTSSGKYISSLLDNHDLAFGWDGILTRREEQRYQEDQDINGNLLDLIDQEYTADVQRLAIFAQDEWEITPQLQVYLGLRWEGLGTKTQGKDLAEVDNTSSVWSPIIQATWKLPQSKKDQLRLAVSRTYKAPATRDLVPRRYTVNNDNGPTNPDRQGNPDLRPELAWGVDVVYEHYFSNDSMVSIAPFFRRINNVTVLQVLQQDGEWFSTPSNLGEATVYGATFEGKLPLRVLIKSAPKININFNTAYNFSRVDALPSPYNRLEKQTPFSGNLSIDYNISQAFQLGGNFNYQGGGKVQVTNELLSDTGPTRGLDIYALWKLDEKTQLRLSVDNALPSDSKERTYYQSNSFDRRITITPSNTGVRLFFEKTL